MTPNETRMDIKSIVPSDINNITALDMALFQVDTSVAAIKTQQDNATIGGTIKVGDLLPEQKHWFLRASGAIKFAKATREALIRRREILWRAHDQIRAALVAIIGAERVAKIEEEARREA